MTRPVSERIADVLRYLPVHTKLMLPSDESPMMLPTRLLP